LTSNADDLAGVGDRGFGYLLMMYGRRRDIRGSLSMAKDMVTVVEWYDNLNVVALKGVETLGTVSVGGQLPNTTHPCCWILMPRRPTIGDPIDSFE
jgi:hypothetical protein